MAKNNVTNALARRVENADSTSKAVDKAYDEMFGLTEEKIVADESPATAPKIVLIELNKTINYANDPFKMYPDEKLKELAQSITEIGLLHPIRVRPKGNSYEILAGRHRAAATRINGEKLIAAIVEEVDDDQAALIVTETNLNQREKLLPSEKAFAYKLQLEAMKRQGKRTDLEYDSTSEQFAQKLSRDIVAEKNAVSSDEIRRHIRLTFLTEKLLELVDIERIPFMVGVDLSYLDEDAQKAVHEFFFEEECEFRLDLKTSAFIRDVFKRGAYPITVKNVGNLLSAGTRKPSPKPFSINRGKFKELDLLLPDDEELERLFFDFLKETFRAKS